MTYTGYFADVKDVPYKVEITTQKEAPDKVLLLSGESPVTITIDQDLYDTFKGQTCTIRIVTDEVFKDMYTNKPDDSTVTVTNIITGQILFRGYITPNAYNQEWQYISEVEIEAVSMESKLQYIDFDYMEFNDTIGLVSFYDLLDHYLNDICGYKNIYITNSFSDGKVPSAGMIKRLSVSTYNFYEDNDDHTPWKCDEVLESILLYLNCSLVIQNNTAYIIDYNSLVNGANFIRLDATNTEGQIEPTQITLNKNHFRGNVSFSMDETFNQIEVEDNSYPIEDINLDFFNNPDLIEHTTTDGTFQNPYQITVVHKDSNGNTESKTYNQYVVNYKNASKYSDQVNVLNPMAKIFKLAQVEVGKEFTSSLDWENTIALYTYISDCGDYYASSNPNITPKKWVDDVYKSGVLDYQQIELTTKESYTFSGTVDSYFIISGSYCAAQSDYKNPSYPPIKRPNDDGIYFDNCNGVSGYNGETIGYQGFRITLQVGNKYYNPSTKNWQDSKAVFALPVGTTTNAWEDWLDITNTVSWDMKLDGVSGYACKIPKGTYLNGKIKITFYTPYVTNCMYAMPYSIRNWSGIKDATYPMYVLLKEFEVKYANEIYTGIDQDYEDDIAYKVDIDTDYVNEGDSLELKVNTQVETKKHSYSSVFLDQSRYVTTLYNKGTEKNQLQEYNIIESRYNHYSTPKHILEADVENIFTPESIVTYTNLTDGKLVMTGQEIDVKQNKSNITLAEV